MYTIFLAFPNHTPALFSGLKKHNSFQTIDFFAFLGIQPVPFEFEYTSQ